MRDEDDLIAALRERARNTGTLPPLSEAQIRWAEESLGFDLPPLLRRIYTDVGNGEFGPHLYPLTSPENDNEQEDSETVVSQYRDYRDHPVPSGLLNGHDGGAPLRVWPESLLLVSHWGCNIYSCVQCSEPDLPVLRYDCNVSWNTFAREAHSLHDWLERWLSGEDLFSLDWDTASKVRFS